MRLNARKSLPVWSGLIKEQYEALARQWLVFEAEVAALLSGHAARIRHSPEISARPERPGCSSWEGLATEARRGIFGCQGAGRAVSDQRQRAFVVEYTRKVTAVDPPAAGGRAALPRPATTHGLPLATSLGEQHCRFVQQLPCILSHYAHKRRLTSSETLPSKG